MIHLKSLELRAALTAPDAFPFNVPVIRALTRLDFTQPVTFFVGENGSGKSTLLEAVALAARLPTAGSAEAPADETLAALHPLARALRLAWAKRPRAGFFLRAEDFFGYARRLSRMRAELERDLRAVDDEYAGRSETARGLARQPHARELADLRRRYGDGLEPQSHGESFLKLFQARFTPSGLYLLDEPEAPLSPSRQLAFLALLRQMIDQQSQFVIATHSPILLAFAEAEIWSFDTVPIRPAAYESLEHVTLTRDFLNHRESYLRRL